MFGSYKIWRDLQQQDAVSSALSEASSVAALQVYKTAYFEFEDSGGSWEADKSTTTNKFVYYKHKDGLVEHELIIYVNENPANLYVSRALPSTIVHNNSLQPSSMTDHCRTMYGANELMKPHMVTMNGTSFPCVPDTPQYSVLVTQSGGSYELPLRRTSGEMAQYIINYRDLRYTPDDRTITRIVKSFQAI